MSISVSPQTLSGKVVLVTGASSGIGRAAAIEFDRRGAKVVASARRRSELDALVAKIKEEGNEASAAVADINIEQDVIDLVATTVSTYGRIDVAFNNAGTEGEFTPFVDPSNEVYDQIFNANVRGVFWSMKHEAKAMLVQGGGTIINNASMGGVIGFANAGLYIASKHAVLGLTKTASIELFKQGVRVNAVNPGIINTPFQDRIWPSTEAKDAFAQRLPFPAGQARPKRSPPSSLSSLRTTRRSSPVTACLSTAVIPSPECPQHVPKHENRHRGTLLSDGKATGCETREHQAADARA